ncbi:helix-turn-helix domain-containing protein [Marinomonas balearica]|uniref:Regulatory Fis family protein n=1 Tax=Marinomonas balearica TaxID=491947 RepID=A0A4R6MA10_9GAMM|nr:helix-turn-helix domain-containing protein [Marinomonas balearica]TDO98283.1 regulatory Fis family protein [Marinomonas balearica]
MKACVIGLSKEEYQTLIPVLHFLDVDWSYDFDSSDILIAGASLSLDELIKVGIPFISLKTHDSTFDIEIGWLRPLPWRQTDILPIFHKILESRKMPRQSGVNLNLHVRHLESLLIRQALVASKGVVSKAAQMLQIQRTTLIEKMRRYHIDKSEY